MMEGADPQLEAQPLPQRAFIQEMDSSMKWTLHCLVHKPSED